MRLLSIKWKLGFMLLSMVAIPTLFLGILSYVTFRQQVISNTENELKAIAQDWQLITNTYIQQEDRVLKRELSLAEYRLQSTALLTKAMLETGGSVSLETDTLGISQFKIGRSGYIFLLDSNGNYIQSKEGLLNGQKFSAALDENGQDISDTILQKVMDLRGDQTYTVTFQKMEAGFSEPRKQLAVFAYSEKKNVVIGALSYYSDFQSSDLRWILQDELKTRMSQQKIKDAGYVWAINSKGEYIVSKDKLRDGENILDATDSDGTPVIRTVVAKATALKNTETFETSYSWRNIGETASNDQLSVFTYVPEWDWIIGVSVYKKEYLAGLDIIRWYIILVCVCAVVVGTIVSYIFSLYLTRPIAALQKAAAHIRDGNLDYKIEVASSDEIGLLSRDLETMRQQLQSRNMKLIESNTSLQNMSHELQVKNEEMQKLNSFMVDREVRMVELKNQIKELEKEQIKEEQ